MMIERIENFMFGNFLYTQILKIVFVITLLFSDIFVFDINIKYAASAVLGSFSGGVVFAYFEKYVNLVQLVVKICISAIIGLFVGAFLNRYYNIAILEYEAICFFGSSLLGLISIKAVIGFWRGNASIVVVTVFQRVFNVQTIEKLKRRKEVKENESKFTD